MKLPPFEMERMQSRYEHEVELNLSESGVLPMSVRELVALAGASAIDPLLEQRLGYPQTNGSERLRGTIASLYPGATAAHVQVTNGGSEANFVAMAHLVEPGDELVFMAPNYMQVWGLAQGLGATVREWWLKDTGRRWQPDLDALNALVTERTKLVALCTPNNPTGARLTASELAAICDIAARGGAWILSDEIYRGAELDDESDSPSAWGRYERVLVTSGLSKAYGLPGLRIGWVVGPPETIAKLWALHDYTTIAPSALSDPLASLALQPDVRAKILTRTRGIVRSQYSVVRGWMEGLHGQVTHVRPEAGAVAFVRYDAAVPSSDLAEQLRRSASTLVVPGSQFGIDSYLRIGFGYGADVLRAGLQRIGDVLAARGRTVGRSG